MIIRYLLPSFLLYGLFFALFPPMGISKEKERCQKSPEAFVSQGLSPDNLSVCWKNQTQLLFCDGEPVQKGFVCSRPSLPGQLRSMTTQEKIWPKKDRDLLAAYSAILPTDRLKVGHEFSIQTGQYGHLSFDPGKQSPCWKTILRSALSLHQNFPEITFVISDRIKNCKALKDGTALLVKRKDKVRKNLSGITTPLHSVFLTDTSKFNHYVMGQMGLYVNVNRRGEIAKRLIDFRIGRDQIPHETSSGRVGGLRH
ncbi:MAG: hypothetical protein H6624_10205 [Bdellovibrionaceae bacterium]|nr:hypothetical protein [Bdellovibrionales bacterium]MCB9084706.1 hypothetical protein [Pseudobdellovibrionaceae bacterium]